MRVGIISAASIKDAFSDNPPGLISAAKETSMYLSLFWTFAKIGVMTFGGGYAMLPILEREVVDNKKWATDAEIMDYYAIGQCTPGVIIVNVATFIGEKLGGRPGGIIATLGVIFPSLVIIALLAALLTEFSHVEAVGHAFAGIRICVCVFIFNAILRLWKSSVKDAVACLLFLIVFIASLFLNISPAIYVILAGIAGVFLHRFASKKP